MFGVTAKRDTFIKKYTFYWVDRRHKSNDTYKQIRCNNKIVEKIQENVAIDMKLVRYRSRGICSLCVIFAH